ncbi:hypothetical protein [Trinickia dinghuensis]|uniref:hypothetical protein n=1 Tax=Trinickia dinghuensis TaxID=2291023 RepID=UPI0015F19CEF|nr:hypothetical protein [Trinickia dinghuensis]
MDAMQRVRLAAAAEANAEDAAVWRWFSVFLEERRIRWRYMFGSWVVHVDRTHVATELTFYDAIRAAKNETESFGVEPSDKWPSRRRADTLVELRRSR